MSLIDAYLLRREDDRRIRAPNILYVTDLVRACPRQTFFAVTEDRPFPIETLRIFNAGRVLEDWWVGFLDGQYGVKVLGTQLPAHVSLKDRAGEPFGVHGRIDILAQHDGARLVIHEVKTAKSTYYVKKEGPKPEHVEQLQFYLHVLGVGAGQLDYLDKKAFLQGETPIETIFEMEHNPNFYKALVKRALNMRDYLRAGTAPANPGAWGGNICKFCKFSDICNEAQI